jgi:putative Mn2+ efflux pump MntP
MLLLALSVSMDNFAVSIAISTTGDVRTFRQMFILAVMSGLFQFFMPLLGWFGGSYLTLLIHGYERWIIFGSLLFVGWCLFHSAQNRDETHFGALSSVSTVLSLAFALSVDSLAIGLGLAMTQVHIFQVSAVIATCAACLTFIGMLLGGRLGQAMGRRSRFAGALVLLVLAFKAIL